MKIVSLFLLFTLSASLACAQTRPEPKTLVSLDPFAKLDKAQPIGSAFAQALYRSYSDLALALKNQPSNQADSLYFARKALLAAGGREVMPSIIDGWALDRRLEGELITARRRLNRMLQPSAAQFAPEEAAKLQVLFDCWVEQSELYASIEAISLCRDRFWRGFSDLQRRLSLLDQAVEFGGLLAPSQKVSIDAFDLKSWRDLGQALVERTQSLQVYLPASLAPDQVQAIHSTVEQAEFPLERLNFLVQVADEQTQDFPRLTVELY